MDNTETYDITDVCRLLGTTSRTLRFYEEKGIISATRSPYSSRRRYTEEQVEYIRYILILRTLGLSVKAISDLQHKGIDLRQAILSKRAEIIATVESLTRELRILNEALTLIEVGDTVESVKAQTRQETYTGEFSSMLTKCTEAVVTGNTVTLYGHIGAALAAAMSPEDFDKVRAETLEPLGKFESYGDLIVSPNHPATFFHLARYEKLGLKITYILDDSKIEGLWLTYCEL